MPAPDHLGNLLNPPPPPGPFLLRWMPEVLSCGYGERFLGLLVNLVQHNAAYLDPSVVAGLVQ